MAGRSGSARRPATPSRVWSGQGVRRIERNRYGYAVVGVIGQGAKAVVYAESGFGIVGVNGYGSTDIDVFFSLLAPIYTGKDRRRASRG